MGAQGQILKGNFNPYSKQWKTYQLRFCFQKIYVINDGLESYLDEKFTKRTNRTVFAAHGSNGKKKKGDSLSVECTYCIVFLL